MKQRRADEIDLVVVRSGELGCPDRTAARELGITAEKGQGRQLELEASDRAGIPTVVHEQERSYEVRLGLLRSLVVEECLCEPQVTLDQHNVAAATGEQCPAHSFDHVDPPGERRDPQLLQVDLRHQLAVDAGEVPRLGQPLLGGR
jgi:hypothetical protein